MAKRLEVSDYIIDTVLAKLRHSNPVPAKIQNKQNIQEFVLDYPIDFLNKVVSEVEEFGLVAVAVKGQTQAQNSIAVEV